MKIALPSVDQGDITYILYPLALEKCHKNVCLLYEREQSSGTFIFGLVIELLCVAD